MTAKRWTIAGLLFVSVAACDNAAEQTPMSVDHPPTVPATTTSVKDEAATAVDLNALIAKQEGVTFRSFDGKWIGMDGDTDLTFLPGGAMHMFEYGVGVTGYAGTYTVDAAGKITLQLRGFNHTWPVMALRKDATSLLLRPAEDGAGFVMGNRGGATFTAGQGTYWPFRPISPAEESGVRERMKTAVSR